MARRVLMLRLQKPQLISSKCRLWTQERLGRASNGTRGGLGHGLDRTRTRLAKVRQRDCDRLDCALTVPSLRAAVPRAPRVSWPIQRETLCNKPFGEVSVDHPAGRHRSVIGPAPLDARAVGQ